MRFPRTSRPTFLGPDIRSIYRGESWAAERARQRRLALEAVFLRVPVRLRVMAALFCWPAPPWL